MKTKEQILNEAISNVEGEAFNLIGVNFSPLARRITLAAMESYAAQLQDMTGGKRELGEISEEHKIGMMKVIYSVWETPVNELLEMWDEAYMEFPMRYDVVDYLRQFYNIENKYAPSTQQLLAEVERLKGAAEDMLESLFDYCINAPWPDMTYWRDNYDKEKAKQVTEQKEKI